MGEFLEVGNFFSFSVCLVVWAISVYKVYRGILNGYIMGSVPHSRDKGGDRISRQLSVKNNMNNLNGNSIHFNFKIS